MSTKANKLTLALATSIAVAGGYTSRQAYAGSCSGGPPTFTCNNPATAGGGDSTQSLSGTPLTVQTNSNFGLDVGSGNGFTLTGSNITFTDNNNSPITSDLNGIEARNDSGAFSINPSGPINSGHYGLYLYSQPGTTNVTVTSSTIDAAEVGIKLTDLGATGPITITAGPLITSGGTGIYFQSFSGIDNLDVTLSANSLDIDGNDGIFVTSDSTANITINLLDGTQNIANDRGVYFRAEAANVYINQSAGSTLISGSDGITNMNSSSPSITIEALGSIRSGGNGILSFAPYDNHSMTIVANNIETSTTGTNLTGAVASAIAVGSYRNTSTGVISITVTGTIIGGTSRAGGGINDVAAGIKTSSSAVATVDVTSTATVSAADGPAIVNEFSDSTTNIAAGGIVIGDIILGLATAPPDGSDLLNFNGSDFSQVTLFDGGDDFDTADGSIDVLTFTGSSGPLTGATVINWEQVVIAAGSTIAISDNAITLGTLHVNSGGILQSSQLGTPGDTLAVTGSAAGNGGGIIQFDTELNDGSTQNSDVVQISGDTSGTTLVAVTRIGGSGGETGTGDGDGILLIEVDGNSAGTFTLAAEVRAGDYLYDLVQSPTNGNWYLQSTFSPAPDAVEEIPTLNQWLQALLTATLGGLAWLGLIRRREFTRRGSCQKI